MSSRSRDIYLRLRLWPAGGAGLRRWRGRPRLVSRPATDPPIAQRTPRPKVTPKRRNPPSCQSRHDPNVPPPDLGRQGLRKASPELPYHGALETTAAINSTLRQFPGNLFIQDILDRQGAHHDAGTAEEGADFGEGVLGVVEGDEEADGALLAGKSRGYRSRATACPRRGRIHP